MINTFTQAVKFIEQYIPTPDKKHPGELGLSRMKYLMDLLGNPQLAYPTIHVGGTSGKGSTSTIIASILATKYKVGLHTSPHLVSINERIKVFDKRKALSVKGKENIPDKEFIDLVNYIKPFVEKVEKSQFGAPSYFEIVAAMAFLYFHMQKVDIAVIEVGMGGRYDATNVINPLVAVITNVGLDHTEILGDTVEKIARDKAGIIKRGINVVTGVRQPSVIDIIKRKALSVKRKREDNNLSLLVPPLLGAYARQFLHHQRSPSATSEVFPWLAFSYRVRKLDSEGSVFDYEGTKLLKRLKLNLLGKHQIENAVLAVRSIELLIPNSLSLRGEKRRSNLYRLPRSFHSLAMTEFDIRYGLKKAFIPGRLEIIRRKPLVILDGAHNPDKVKALVNSIKKIFPKKKVTTIIAIKNDKNAKEMLVEILKLSKKIIFTKFELTGDVGIISSYDPEKLLEITHNIDRQHRYTSRHTKMVREMKVVPYAKQALKEAIRPAKAGDLILVTGSLYLIGEIKSALSVKGKA